MKKIIFALIAALCLSSAAYSQNTEKILQQSKELLNEFDQDLPLDSIAVKEKNFFCSKMSRIRPRFPQEGDPDEVPPAIKAVPRKAVRGPIQARDGLFSASPGCSARKASMAF